MLGKGRLTSDDPQPVVHHIHAPYVWCFFFSWPGYAVVVVGLLSQPTEATLAVRESQLREPGK